MASTVTLIYTCGHKYTRPAMKGERGSITRFSHGELCEDCWQQTERNLGLRNERRLEKGGPIMMYFVTTSKAYWPDEEWSEGEVYVEVVDDIDCFSPDVLKKPERVSAQEPLAAADKYIKRHNLPPTLSVSVNCW